MALPQEQRNIIIIVIIVIVALFLFSKYRINEGYNPLAGGGSYGHVAGGGSYGHVQNEIYWWPYPRRLC